MDTIQGAIERIKKEITTTFSPGDIGCLTPILNWEIHYIPGIFISLKNFFKMQEIAMIWQQFLPTDYPHFAIFRRS